MRCGCQSSQRARGFQHTRRTLQLRDLLCALLLHAFQRDVPHDGHARVDLRAALDQVVEVLRALVKQRVL